MATKIYSDGSSLIVESQASKACYPVGSVSFTIIGDIVDFEGLFKQNLSYTAIQDENGNGFASIGDTFTYLKSQQIPTVNASFTPAGMQDVDIVANSIGLATEATLQNVDSKLQDLVLDGMKQGTTDPNNSTSAALNAGDTWTGTATNVSAYASVVVACKTDKDASLEVQFSVDGSNWDSSLTYSVAAGVNEVHRITVTRAYMRVKVTNTTFQNMTYLRVQTLLGNQQSLTSTLGSTVQTDADALLVRPVDFNLLLAEGLYQNRTITVKDGLNLDVDTATVPEDISNEGGVYAGFPTGAPEEGQIVVAGADTGTVYYFYLASSSDTDYSFGSKAVAGAGNYDLGHNIWRCNFAYFVGSSATSANVGDITIRNKVTTANVFCVIGANYGQSYCSAYTVPAGSSIYIDRFNGNLRGTSTGSLDGAFWYRPLNESPRLRFPFELQYGSLYFDDVDYLIRIPEKVDLVPRILSASANNLIAKFSWRLLKVKS